MLFFKKHFDDSLFDSTVEYEHCFLVGWNFIV